MPGTFRLWVSLRAAAVDSERCAQGDANYVATTGGFGGSEFGNLLSDQSLKGFAVIEAMTLLYLVGVVITAVVTFALARHWRADDPHAGSVSLSVFTGVLWPLVAVGGLQIGTIALLIRMLRTQRGTTSDYALAR